MSGAVLRAGAAEPDYDGGPGRGWSARRRGHQSTIHARLLGNIAGTPAPYRRAGSVSDAATVNRVAAPSSRCARASGAVAAWEGRAYSSSFFSSSGRLPEPLKYHSPSSSMP